MFALKAREKVARGKRVSRATPGSAPHNIFALKGRQTFPISPLQGENSSLDWFQGWRAKRAYPWLLSLAPSARRGGAKRQREEQTYGMISWPTASRRS
jgi:hypothetical protein